jgi:hypothetical protein
LAGFPFSVSSFLFLISFLFGSGSARLGLGLRRQLWLKAQYVA